MSVFEYHFFTEAMHCKWLLDLIMLSDSTCILEGNPGRLHIRRRKPVILIISLPIDSLFKIAMMT